MWSQNPISSQSTPQPVINVTAHSPSTIMTTELTFSHQLTHSDIPRGFLCPISNALMSDPVMSLHTGINFEESAIIEWMAVRGDVCPVTGGEIGNFVPNGALQLEIYLWQQYPNADDSVLQRAESSSNTPAASYTAVERAEKKKRWVPDDVMEQHEQQLLDILRTHSEYSLQQNAIMVNAGNTKRVARQSQSIFKRGPTLYNK
jgi:hypothetical protein